jgi:putative phage-type endonuclease
MKIIECIQGSPEWFAARLGKVSASRVADVIAKTKTGWGASRANYAADLVAERLTGATAEKYSNAAMAWGTETEPQARSMYEFMRDCDVVEVGTVLHPTIDMSCASPDGLVGDEGLVEIKCPNTATHIDTLLGDAIAGKYITQMQWQMACTGRKWCDFVSFDPRMPGDMQILVSRVARDDAMIADLEKHVIAFIAEVDETIRALEAKFRQREAA